MTNLEEVQEDLNDLRKSTNTVFLKLEAIIKQLDDLILSTNVKESVKENS